jgi:hypothetical protein
MGSAAVRLSVLAAVLVLPLIAPPAAQAQTLIFDRFENKIYCNASETQEVWCVHTYEPPIAWWPGYFVALIEVAAPKAGKRGPYKKRSA